MKTIPLAAAVLAVLAATSPALAQNGASSSRVSTITVGGQGAIDRNPDQAIVSLTIITNDDNATRATSANNSTYNALVAKLAGLGVPASAIRTTSYGLNYNPHPQQANQQFPQRYGFVVNRGLAVTASRTDQAGAIVDAAVSSGVSNVDGIAFGLHDQRSAYRQAQAAAVADAEAQAHALAAAAHVRIVRVLDISSGSVIGPRPVVFGAERMAMAAAPVPTDVQPSALTVTANVTITYEVAP